MSSEMGAEMGSGPLDAVGDTSPTALSGPDPISDPISSAMRVELTVDGGFAYIPGLAGPIVADGAQLAASDAAKLRRLCAAALAVAKVEPEQRPAAMPDARRYGLTIDIDGKRHDLIAADPIRSPAIAALIVFVREHGVARNP